MTQSNKSRLWNKGEEMGMTNEQYKGMLAEFGKIFRSFRNHSAITSKLQLSAKQYTMLTAFSPGFSPA